MNGFWGPPCTNEPRVCWTTRSLFSDLCSQHKEKLVSGPVVWIPGIPLWKGLLLRGTRFESQITGPQTTTWPLAEPKINTSSKSRLGALRRSGTAAHLFQQATCSLDHQHLEDGLPGLVVRATPIYKPWKGHLEGEQPQLRALPSRMVKTHGFREFLVEKSLV